MSRMRWLVAFAAVVLATACSDDGAANDASSASASGSDGGTTSSSAGTLATTTTVGATDESAATSLDSSGGATSGPKLDVGLQPDLGGGEGGPVDESTCELAANNLTSAGCRFAPIIGGSSTNLPWAVVAANATGVAAAEVTLYAASGAVIESAMVDPGQLHTFVIDPGSPELNAHVMASATGVVNKALLLESDRPVVAYQFSPYSSSQVATADASLLLPDHAWGTDHLVPSYHNSDISDSWVTIVSLVENTEVTVEMPTAMVGSTSAGGGVPALAAGESFMISVGAQDALRVVSPGSSLADLTGMRVTSMQPVAIFTGSPSMSLPGPGMNYYKDYLEEQIPPRTAWGTEVVVVKFRPRSIEPDLYRVLADADGTTVTMSGGYVDQLVLDAGEFHEFLTPEDFVVEGSDAILVAHYMLSQDQSPGAKNDVEYPGAFISDNCDFPSQQTTELGDPAITFVPPAAQWRYVYTFLTPTTYAWDMVTVVGPMNGWNSIALDAGPLPAPTAIAGTTWGFARFLIEDGPHDIRSDSTKFGIEVYGYDCRISYAYPGGLSLGLINEPEG
jgi:hypothetical protein